ncbi:putative odorant receptor 59c [Drosophila pseudoobscura]|uniref:Odorant receptor n=1 Tax=Drosophila pseudoobscura pseudoobscura TaxID=46245 RepID=A0A6I8UUL6_DROPS|nr:putative odorant receptor 59c [Drosophila pseudoobscura]
MKKPLFERLRPVPLTKSVVSSDACIYFYRAATFLGWVPPKARLHRWAYLLWTCTTMVLGLVYLPLGLTLTYVVHFDKFAASEFLTSVQVDINCIGNCVKACVTFSQMWRMRRINAMIAPLDERCTTLNQRQILHKMVARGNRIIVFFLSMYIGFTTTTLFSSVFAGKAPWQVYNPLVDWRQGTRQLWEASLLEYIVINIGICQELLSDSYPIVFLSIFRGHLAILKDRIKNLRCNPELSENENYQQLVDCIKDYRTIVQCCDLIRPIMSATIFAQFMLIGIVVGVASVNILFFTTSFWMTLSNIIFIAAICAESFPLCMTCELLIEDCESLASGIFHSNWMDAERRYRSAIIYFLHRVQQPIQFWAGAIFPISVQSNITVAKFAFSIITIVNQMNLADKFRKEA